MTIRLLAVLLLIVPAGCKRSEPDPPPPVSTAKQPAQGNSTKTPLDRSFRYTCSPDKEVSCNGILPVRPAPQSTAAVLWSGEDAFRARIASLRRAKRSIRIQALIFRGDEAGLHIAELLKQKKKQGMKVRVIVDAMSNLDWQTQWMYFDLKKHGVEVEGYEALYMQWVTADLKPTDPLRPNKRFHDKMWIIDAEDPANGLAIVGGLNIANEYFRIDTAPINRWHDQDIALRGAIVGDVTRTFDRNYRFFKKVKGRLPSIHNPDNSWKLTRKILGKISGAKIPFWKRPALVAAIKSTLEGKASLSWTPVTARFLQSRPRFKETYIEQTYLHLIKRAKKRVLIANAYFVPNRELTSALKDAARRGVRVVILTNSPATNDIEQVAVVSRYLYLGLLKQKGIDATGKAVGVARGIEIHEWQGKPFNEGTLHAKYALFDDDTAIIGSYNLDPRSARLNSETAVALRHGKLVAKLTRAYLDQLLPKAKRITLAEARAFHKPADINKRFKLLFALPLKDWL